MLEHMVDTVLYFEGDKTAMYRMLRGVKNRFGSTNEVGVFEMQNQGLVEVPNPSEYLMRGRLPNEAGSVVASHDGSAPAISSGGSGSRLPDQFPDAKAYGGRDRL